MVLHSFQVLQLTQKCLVTLSEKSGMPRKGSNEFFGIKFSAR